MADPIAQKMTDQAEMEKMDPDRAIPATERYDLMKNQRLGNLRRRANVLRQFFLDNGIVKATVEYSGSGDSGSGMLATITMADGTERDDVNEINDEFVVEGVPTRASSWDDKNREWKETDETREEPLAELLCAMADEFVDINHGGYENNEGGEGTVTFTLDGVEVSHADFILERIQTPREFYPKDVP